LVGELPSPTCSFLQRLIMYLEQDLVGIIIGMLGDPISTSKSPPSTGFDENVVGHSALVSY